MRPARRCRMMLLCATLAMILPETLAFAGPPEIVHKADTRPDRGNNPQCEFITGPEQSLGRFNNGDLEISFWNQPAEMTFSLAKNDVWDRRYFGDRKKIITLEDVRRACCGGKAAWESSSLGNPNGIKILFPDAPQALYHSYDFPCPKPVGQVIVRCPDLQQHDQYVVGNARDGTVVAKASKGNARGTLWSFVPRARNLLVIRGEYSGLTQPLEVQLYRHKDTTPQGTSIYALAHHNGKTNYDYSQDPDNGPLPPPQAGSDGRFFWIRQSFPADKTFPKGFDSVFAVAVDGASYEVKVDQKAKDAGAKFVVHPIAPEVYKKLEGYKQEMRIAAERLNHAEYGSLATATMAGPSPSFTLYVAAVTTRDAADPLSAAQKMLAEALQEGSDKIAQTSASLTHEAERAWKNSRVMHYNATSCSFADATCWHGDYHFNEVYCLDTIVAGRSEDLDQRILLCEEMLPALRRHAREVFQCDGICFPLVHYPIRHDRVVYGNVTWELGIENTALMLQFLWQIHQYTQDKEFLRTRAYPLMLEGAKFYADYPKKGADGRWHIIPTTSQEHWSLTSDFRLNRDSVGALSFAKYHLKACIQASEILGVDAPLRERWREIADHLAPYPTLSTKEGPVFCDVRDAPRLLNYNNTANLIMVLWAEDISLDSPPELLEMARRSYRAIPDKEHSPRKGYLQQIELFLGIPEKPFLTPQGRVLSWPGRIHLYAGVPKGVSLNDRFAGLLAVGGFEVSAARVGGEVRDVRIKSRAGGVCKVKSPWDPKAVQVLNQTKKEPVKHTLDCDTIVFPTQAGDTYVLLSGSEQSKMAGSK